MSKPLFLYKDGQIVGEYADDKAVKAAFASGQFQPGKYTKLTNSGDFEVGERPSRVVVKFTSNSTRGPRKPKAEGEAPAVKKPRKGLSGLLGN